MIPRELLATAVVPGGTAELRCYRHDGAFQLFLGRTELMSSRVHESERQLADLVLAAVADRVAPQILIGGLGMGFTLAQVLATVGPAARVRVVELVPEVVQWNRELFGHCAGHPLRDPRVEVQVADVFDAVCAARNSCAGILLDVDNGPEALVHPDNERLYGPRGLVAAREALVPGGVLGVWSSADSPEFGRRLEGVGLAVTTHHVRARGRKGPRRTIWTAQRR
ncbi:MAG: hypothetical protein JNK49_01510 [Planctomycetes bacterium]|nr:hypothetical protein [Planctomycetota bacterium]